MLTCIKKILKQISMSVSGLFKKRQTRDFRYVPTPGELPYFDTITVKPITPSNAEIGDKEFIEVVYKGNPIWALFKCPCGCGTVISLSLQTVHRPYWTLSKSKKQRPTLYPSVYQKKGCCSHFWITDGYINWATF